MTVYVMFVVKGVYLCRKKNIRLYDKNSDRIVNFLMIQKSEYEINRIALEKNHSCYDFICKEIFVVRTFEKSIQIYCTIQITILIICKKKKKTNLI